MNALVYSSRAEDDYEQISIYTQQEWGLEQADRYIEQIEQACKRLARFPGMGRTFSAMPGVFRFEEGSHIIFYRRTTDGILVGRILHKSADPARHAI